MLTLLVCHQCCQLLLSQVDALQEHVRLETTTTWKQEVLARPLLDVQVRNSTEVTVMAVAVICEFKDSGGIAIYRTRAFLPQALRAGETRHLNGSSFAGLPHFERAKCESEGV